MPDLPNLRELQVGSGADPLREFVAECLRMSAFYANMGCDHAGVQDDAGLERSVEQSVACTRQAVAVLKMLVEANEKAAAERGATRARQTPLGRKETRQ